MSHPASDSTLKSFLPVSEHGHFPIQNLPYGIFVRKNASQQSPAIGVAIGDFILDLAVLRQNGFFETPHLKGQDVFSRSSLNAFMALGRPAWREARSIITRLLRIDEPALRDRYDLRAQALLPMADAQLHLPVEIGDYTDFYASREHATNVGIMFRGKENALMPNWLHLPVGYHGRASSVVLSGSQVRRPQGQSLPDGASAPVFGRSRQLDFELEVGCLVGTGNALAQPIPIAEAEKHVFGVVLVNDWSARDFQRWEYQPLGPFLSKNFITSISPWVVPMDALEPFRIAGPQQSPDPLPYLRHQQAGHFDMRLQVSLQSSKMASPQILCRTSTRYLYWSFAQQVAHHTVTGCNLRTGDLLASGTISGPTEGSYGSLLELAWRGTKPIKLNSGEQRTFLEDGDTVSMTGWCQGEGYRVGFGEVVGTVLPANPQ